MEDAKFEDGQEAPLNLGALDSENLEVLSALTQDAVFPITEMKWDAAQQRFALLVNRFRWEDNALAKHRPERVQSLLVIENVSNIATMGIDRSDQDTILSLLAISFEAEEDAAGYVLLTLAGDGALRLHVEALEVTLKDVTRPYGAPSRQIPNHSE